MEGAMYDLDEAIMGLVLDVTQSTGLDHLCTFHTVLPSALGGIEDPSSMPLCVAHFGLLLITSTCVLLLHPCERVF
jgi:hypothetical protein